MKKLSKNLNSRKENIEAYSVYFGCNCECQSYCKGDQKASYRNYKSLQGYNSERE